MNAEQFLQQARAGEAELIGCRHWLHSHPGTGFDIQETVEYVEQQLTAMGYAPRRCGRAGLVALAGGKKPGKVFLLRADMDALPMAEQSGVEFAAGNGKMHACGHDLHTAMLLGAARLLKAHEDEIQGTVKLMFQPAEEIFEGSHDMIEAGVLQDPPVDAALMIHVMAGMPFPAGTVMVSAPGVSAPAADLFEIQVQGKGCHGSAPNKGVDPLTSAAQILLALQEINARELGLNQQAVLTIGSVHGGNAPNVIPDSAVLTGSIRTFDEDTRAYLKQRIGEIAGGIAAALRAEAKASFGSGCPTLKNDAALSQCAERYTAELLGERRAVSVAKLNAAAAASGQKSGGMAGSEDFAYVSQQVPALMLALAAGEPAKGYAYPQHHPKVKFDESVLADGSAVYAYNAMRWLEEHA